MIKKELYLAGGPFHGLQEVFSRIYGVLDTVAGYAHGAPREDGTLPEGTVECVKVVYNPNRIDIGTLLSIFFTVVNPYTDGIQGKCQGPRYRSGIYYTSKEDVPQISYYMLFIQHRGESRPISESCLVVNEFEGEKKFRPPIRTELAELDEFHPAPEEAQHLYRKDPSIYTPIDIPKLEELGVFKKHY